MQNLIVTSLLAVVYAPLTCVTVHADVDLRPLKVQITPAFPGLQWPDSLTGASEGLIRDPRPIVVTGAGDGTNRIFVATQYGTIHDFENRPDIEQMNTFLDLRDRVVPFNSRQNEEGLLGFALHPDFKNNGEVFVYYTAAPTDDAPHLSIISRFRSLPG
ncbi:MAG: hypothetical protein AAF961_08370, partial [Planctomycetota bacterium]